MNNWACTIFCDIDGVLVKHHGNLTTQILRKMEALDGAVNKLNEWEREGHCIILTTGRKESMRKLTEKQLNKLGIFYDKLIMGLPRGTRFVINDGKPNIDTSTAVAIQLPRNQGIKDVNLDIYIKVKEKMDDK